jgi:hypothetical protein
MRPPPISASHDVYRLFEQVQRTWRTQFTLGDAHRQRRAETGDPHSTASSDTSLDFMAIVRDFPTEAWYDQVHEEPCLIFNCVPFRTRRAFTVKSDQRWGKIHEQGFIEFMPWRVETRFSNWTNGLLVEHVVQLRAQQ